MTKKLLAFILACFMSLVCVDTTSAQFYRRGVCNCPMCQAIRAGTWQGSYAATFGTTYGTTRTIPSTSFDRSLSATPLPAVERMVELAELTSDDLVYDPGCGDGRIIEEAVRTSGCQAVGIEIVPDIAERARDRLRGILSGRWRIHTGDSHDLNLSQATVAIMYMYSKDLQRIVPKLTNCRRIISWQHPVPGLTNRSYQHRYGVIYVADQAVSKSFDMFDSSPILEVSGKTNNHFHMFEASLPLTVTTPVQKKRQPTKTPTPVLAMRHTPSLCKT